MLQVPPQSSTEWEGSVFQGNLIHLRLGAYMQFLVERLLAESCARRREPLRLMGVRIHHDSCSNSR
jgi:hypothetical protein